MRRLRQVATVIGTILLTLGSTINVGQAATLITNIVRKPTPADVNNPNIVFRDLCPPTCQLRDEESLNTNLPPTIVTNNSTFNLTSVIYTIPQDVDAQWDQAITDIYNNFTISPDTKVLTFFDGLIPVGEEYFVFRETNDGRNVPFTVEDNSTSLNGTSVPEPASVLSLLAIGAIGATSAVARLLKQKA